MTQTYQQKKKAQKQLLHSLLDDNVLICSGDNLWLIPADRGPAWFAGYPIAKTTLLIGVDTIKKISNQSLEAISLYGDAVKIYNKII